MTSSSLIHRPSRLRRNTATRALLRNVRLHPEQLIAPLFVHASISKPKAIASMPGHHQLPLSDVVKEVQSLHRLGIRAVILFGIPSHKDAQGTAALDDNGIVQEAIRLIKAQVPDMLVISDLCFCEYTDHGHCGMLCDDGQQLDHDKTLPQLQAQALSHARAGVDWIAPSGMIDGMVGAIRTSLDSEGYTQIPILSYAVKYSSAFYGPFRDAAEGSPQFGDRRSYQMDPANAEEWRREAALDIAQGADMLMVKPALSYLDIIQKMKTAFPEYPLCAYQVSGEFSLIKFGAKQGLINEQDTMVETLNSIHRAGADMIISYFAKDYAQYWKNHHP